MQQLIAYAGLGPRSLGMVLFAPFWSKIWTILGYWRRLECSIWKNKVTFVSEAQKVCACNLIFAFLALTPSNIQK